MPRGMPPFHFQPFSIDFSNDQKGYLMWAVAFGSMLGTFPFTLLYARFGARLVLFFAGILSALATAAIPLAALLLGFGPLLVLRFFQVRENELFKQFLFCPKGIAYSADFAAMGMICSRWASLKQNALFISVLPCYSPLSTALTNPIAGIVCIKSTIVNNSLIRFASHALAGRWFIMCMPLFACACSCSGSSSTTTTPVAIGL